MGIRATLADERRPHIRIDVSGSIMDASIVRFEEDVRNAAGEIVGRQKFYKLRVQGNLREVHDGVVLGGVLQTRVWEVELTPAEEDALLQAIYPMWMRALGGAEADDGAAAVPRRRDGEREAAGPA